jgi:hypothetical protein
MHKSVLTAIVFAMGALGYAAQADADLISIGLQETGVNGGAIITETTGSAAARSGRSAMRHSGSTRPPHKIPQGSDYLHH